MDPAQWIAGFKILHEQMKKGLLKDDEQKKYVAMAEELARSLMAAQGMAPPSGVPARRAFRVAHVFPIEIDNVSRTMTREISCQGFTATVNGMFKEGQQISWALTLSRGTDPMQGMATVETAPRIGGGSSRVTANFNKLTEAQLQRLELALVDAALSRFG
ncbi:MAG: hypothetical protein ACOZQL_22195 [Myxococcota bacterium]